MPENTVPTVSQESGSQPTQSPTQSVQISPELQRELAMAFGEQPTPSSAQPQNEGQPPNTPPTEVVPPSGDTEESFEESEYLKQYFGSDDITSIVSQWKEIEQLKLKAQTPAEIKFANDEAKKWATYFMEGKEDELYNSLHARQQIKNLDGMNDEQKVKLFIKMNNPMFDQELIDYQFNKDYSFDESPYKDEEGIVTDPMGLRYAKMSAQQRMQNDLQKANEYFSQYRTKIDLSDIQPQRPVDNDYEGYKASNAQAKESYNNVIVPAVNALKESDAQFNVKVDDANNQMQFDVAIVPDTNDFNEAKNQSLHFNDYVQNAFFDEKGNFLASKLQRAILLEKNFDKYAQSIARQAVNAERKRVVAKEGGRTGGDRDFNVVQPEQTEFQKQANMAFAV